ncbi:leucine-rich repeat extensin-like protein 5 [Helianthus annuus]|uniref:leucine-rich repeat extensin-like protein 5 n=1 Tax=Helianthus annuus TaxID=4232 RepID=UPI000B9080BD|nr:leucine-rich repeat extensin-like protein 5 [Helianthus annuus]
MKRENQTQNIGTSNRRKSFRNNRPPIATFPKTTATSKKPQTTATTKPKPSSQKPPQKKQKTTSSPPPSSTKPTDVDATKASTDVRPSVVETPVVLTAVSQTTAPMHFDPPPPTPQRFPSQSTFSPKPPSPSKTPPPPKYAYARKRKFVVLEEEKEIPSPILLSSAPAEIIPPSSSPQTNPLDHPPTGYMPRVIPWATQYPLELLAAQDEMMQFYKIEDPSKRAFPSLYGFRIPQNFNEYLKLKARQAELIAKEESKGLGDRRYQGLMQHGLSKVRKLEDFARDLSKSMPELPPNADLQEELRVDYLDLIMKTKPYKANKSQFKDWPLDALKEEINRIE